MSLIWIHGQENIFSLLVRNSAFWKENVLSVAWPLMLPPAALECKNVKATCRPYREELSSHQIQLRGPVQTHKQCEHLLRARPYAWLITTIRDSKHTHTLISESLWEESAQRTHSSHGHVYAPGTSSFHIRTHSCLRLASLSILILSHWDLDRRRFGVACIGHHGLRVTPAQGPLV